MNAIETARSAGIEQRLTDGLSAIATGYVVGTTVYRVGKEIMANRDKKPSMLPYCEDLAEVMDKGGYRYALLGGLPIDAFNADDSVIDVENQTITVSEDFQANLIRGNGTRRDFDVVVFPSKKAEPAKPLRPELIKLDLVGSTRERARRADQPTPVISVFTFDVKPSLIHTSTMLNSDGTMTLQHGSAKADLPENAMESWDLVLPTGTSIKILNPWEQYWRSMVRFSSGTKLKDTKKLDTMSAKLRSVPGLAEQEHDEINSVYSSYYPEMLKGNSRQALNEAYEDPDRDWQRVMSIGTRVLASRIMAKGQNSALITWFVQQSPDLFDRFVGADT